MSNDQIASAANVAAYQDLAWILSLALSQNITERVLFFSVDGCGQRLRLVVCRQISNFQWVEQSEDGIRPSLRSKTCIENVYLKIHGT